MNLIEKWKNRETKKKLREENIRLKDRLKRGYMNVVTLDKMSISKIQDLPRDTIVFYVEESVEEEYWEIMKLAYDRLIGVLKVSESQLRHMRRIMAEHPTWYGDGFERIS